MKMPNQKKLLLISLIAPYICLAQTSIKINYNQVYVGKNISVDFDYQIDKILLSLGAVYYPGIDKKKIPFNTFYKNRGTPSNAIQHFGLQFNIGYKIYANNHFDLFGVYKGNLASMNTYIKFLQTYTPLIPEPQGIEDYAITIEELEFGPLFSFDNTFGLLFKGKITRSLFFNLHGGIGFTYLKNNDEFTITPENFNGTINLSTTFSIGLGYSFNRIKSKNQSN